MKKLLLILCLLSMIAHAEWKYDTTSTNLSNNYDSYLDYSKIRTEGRYKSIWHLKDYKLPETEATGKQFKSVMSKNIVDCQASKSQIVALYFYSEQMGKGEMVNSGNYQIKESDWQYPPPNSISDGFIKVACATNSNSKPPVSNTQDIKRQRCINLGLAPNSADFQQCIK